MVVDLGSLEAATVGAVHIFNRHRHCRNVSLTTKTRRELAFLQVTQRGKKVRIRWLCEE